MDTFWIFWKHSLLRLNSNTSQQKQCLEPWSVWKILNCWVADSWSIVYDMIILSYYIFRFRYPIFRHMYCTANFHVPNLQCGQFFPAAGLSPSSRSPRNRGWRSPGSATSSPAKSIATPTGACSVLFFETNIAPKKLCDGNLRVPPNATPPENRALIRPY